MNRVGESEYLGRIIARAGECAGRAAIGVRALRYVRSLFPDDDVQPGELRSSVSQYLFAEEDAGCEDRCVGREACRKSGLLYVVERQEGFRGGRAYIAGVAQCRHVRLRRKQGVLERVAAASRIPDGMTACTFENFTTENCPPIIGQAKAAALDCVGKGGGLVLGGSAGTGKTHLAVAITQALVAGGKHAVFIPVVELLDEMRKATAAGRADEIMDAVRNAECLALDDLGAERTNDWVGERLFALVDHRYRHKEQTIVTTNAMNMAELERMIGDRGTRIVSRLAQMAFPVFIKARDYRFHRDQGTLFKAG